MKTPAGLLAFLLLSSIPAAAQERPASFLDEGFLTALGRIEDGGGQAASAEGQAAPPSHENAFALVMKNLAGSKVPAEYARDAFDDPATKVIEEIPGRFKKPAEAMPYEKYRLYFVTEAKISLGARFYAEHQDLLEAVSKRFAVEPLVLVSILGVETHYGAGQGHIQVFNALYTIVRTLPRRSAWAAKELAEFLKLCHREGFAPHGVMGSYAGAFGFYQFMPSSYNAYAVDFDGDGKSAYDQWPDVLATMANFLKGHGAQPSEDYSPDSRNRRAIHGYNPSDNYVRAVVELRENIKARPQAPASLASDPIQREKTAAQAARVSALGGVFESN